MSESKTSASGGIGIAGLLGLLFVGLKLGQVGEVASWSWLWVLSPFWIPVAILLAVAVVVLLAAGVATLLASLAVRRIARDRARRPS